MHQDLFDFISMYQFDARRQQGSVVSGISADCAFKLGEVNQRIQADKVKVDEVGTHQRRRLDGVGGELVPIVQQRPDLFLSGKRDGLGLHPRCLALHSITVEASQELSEMADDAL